jgi:hypothetical protein
MLPRRSVLTLAAAAAASSQAIQHDDLARLPRTRISSKPPLMAGSRTAWALPVSPTCLPNGQGSATCSAFRRTDSAFEPSLYQRQSPPSGNAIFQGRDKDPETAPAIQWADCRDKMRARIAASSGLFALNREISVCAGLRGRAGGTRTSNQTVISR